MCILLSSFIFSVCVARSIFPSAGRLKVETESCGRTSKVLKPHGVSAPLRTPRELSLWLVVDAWKAVHGPEIFIGFNGTSCLRPCSRSHEVSPLMESSPDPFSLSLLLARPPPPPVLGRLLLALYSDHPSFVVRLLAVGICDCGSAAVAIKEEDACGAQRPSTR
jgi:hypothetical protein